jgi:hypothetical protein
MWLVPVPAAVFPATAAPAHNAASTTSDAFIDAFMNSLLTRGRVKP